MQAERKFFRRERGKYFAGVTDKEHADGDEEIFLKGNLDETGLSFMAKK